MEQNNEQTNEQNESTSSVYYWAPDRNFFIKLAHAKKGTYEVLVYPYSILCNFEEVKKRCDMLTPTASLLSLDFTFIKPEIFKAMCSFYSSSSPKEWLRTDPPIGEELLAASNATGGLRLYEYLCCALNVPYQFHTDRQNKRERSDSITSGNLFERETEEEEIGDSSISENLVDKEIEEEEIGASTQIDHF